MALIKYDRLHDVIIMDEMDDVLFIHFDLKVVGLNIT